MARSPHPDLFVEDDEPVKFFLHDSLTPGQQEELRRAIEANGGKIHDIERESDTVIARDEMLNILRRQYSHSKTVYVEDCQFVFRCIRSNEFEHEPMLVKRMPGRPPGKPRNDFTPEEDQLLVRYIATRIPGKKDGGRMGEKIYKELCDPTHAEEWNWPAERHSWHSWQNRYKKNQRYFNPLIDEYLEENPPHPQGKGEYNYKRNAAGYAQRHGQGRPRVIAERREAEEEADEEDAENRPIEVLSGSEDEQPAKEKVRNAKRRQNDGDESTPEKARKRQRDSDDHEGSVDFDMMGQADDMLFNDMDQNERYRSQSVELEPQATRMAGPSRSPRPRKGHVPQPSSSAQPTQTNARERAARTQGAAPPDTQRTLIATQQSQIMEDSDIEEIEEADTVGRREQVESPAVTPPPRQQAVGDELSDVPAEDVIVVNAVPPLSATQRARAARKTPANSPTRPPTQISLPSSPTAPTRVAATRAPLARHGAAQKKAARPAQIVREVVRASQDAPYRNTRGRSRSIEPAALPAPSKKQKGKGKMGVEPLPEISDEELPEMRDIIPLRETISESLENESLDQVENALDVEVDTQETPVIQEETIEAEIMDADKEEAATDEEEEEEEVVTSESSEDEDDSQVFEHPLVKRLAGRLSSAPTPTQSGFRAPSNSSSNSNLRTASVFSRPTPTQFTAAAVARTPIAGPSSQARARISRLSNTTINANDSESELDMFPTPGTRARGERVARESTEKHLPYEAIAGTRAAEFKLSQSPRKSAGADTVPRRLRSRQVTV